MNHEQRITDHESAAECLTEPGRVTRPDVFQLLAREDSDGTSALNVREGPPLSGIELTIKRLVDIGGALFGLVLFSPVMLLISILIPLTSRGPVLYRQKRVGLDGQIFEILKFRSMTVCEDGNTMTQASRNDSRCTRVGEFLRKTSLDELPQLVNVLQGTMSIVGPRPHAVKHSEQCRSIISDYMLRHLMKPGITGWAQVNGWRGNTSIEKRVECDLYYIQNWSLWFDLWIILLTIVKGFINKNAY